MPLLSLLLLPLPARRGADLAVAAPLSGAAVIALVWRRWLTWPLRMRALFAFDPARRASNWSNGMPGSPA